MRLMHMKLHSCTPCLLVLVMLPAVAWADGKVVGALVVQQPVELPDQQAIVCFASGVETLAIQTAFDGEGTEFAWIVPLPSVPTSVRAVSVGTFETLRMLSRPEVGELHGLAWLTVALGLILLTYLLRDSQLRNPVVGGCGCFWIVALMPVLGESGSSPDATTVLRREVVGSYDTSVLRSESGRDLVRWLESHGYHAPPGLAEAAAPLIDEGWCFVAAQMTKEGDAAAKTHPLAFTFPTPRPIYPMRLTGFGATRSLLVDLYVFADGSASATGFARLLSARTGIPERGQARRFPVVHPGLLELAGDATVLTHLRGSLPPALMQQDVALHLGGFDPHLPVVYTEDDRLLVSVTGGLAALLITIFVSWRLRVRRERLQNSPVEPGENRARSPRVALGGSILFAVFVAAPLLLMPTAEIAEVPLWWRSVMIDEIREVAETNPPDLEEFRRRVAARTTDVVNRYNAEPVREEDSPGNYRLEEVYGRIELILYSHYGEPQRWYEPLMTLQDD